MGTAVVGKGELIKAVAKRTGLSQENVRNCLEAIFAEILNEVRAGKRVSIKGFGSFKPVVRKGGKKRNPRTGGTVEVPTKVVLKFNPSESVKVLKILK